MADIALPPDLRSELRDLRRRLDNLERSPRAYTASGVPVLEAVANTFSMTGASVATKESTSSGSYTDLSTLGPQLSVGVSATGNLMVFVSAEIEVDVNKSGAMSVQLGGANASLPSDSRAFLVSVVVDPLPTEDATVKVAGGKAIIYTGLNPGTTTVTAKYRGDGVSATDFSNRTVIAIPF